MKKRRWILDDVRGLPEMVLCPNHNDFYTYICQICLDTWKDPIPWSEIGLDQYEIEL